MPAERAGAARLAVVGVSLSSICGVRDHAERLADALHEQGISCSVHWLSRDPASSPRAAWSQMRAFARALNLDLRADPPDAVLLHYSAFAYAYRGVPLFARPLLLAISGTGAPVVVLLHELAYPWRRRGWRGAAWALTQRAALVDVMRVSTAVVLTADFQAEWVASRRWLPRRRAAIAPVFSNLPPARTGALADGGPRSSSEERSAATIGLFGYASEGVEASMTLDALRLLEDRGCHARLRLLGAPGARSSSGEAWLDGARKRQLEDGLSFSGVLSAQELANQLAACDVLLFVESDGPTTRKTTLAASLASGRPVIAIDGRRTWSELTRAGVAQIVQPSAHALADAIQTVLADANLSETLGARGRAFAEQRMSATSAAGTLIRLLGELNDAQTWSVSVASRADSQLERAVR
jgi:glycosyltransferase involved in cell wall biosynthesis